MGTNCKYTGKDYSHSRKLCDALMKALVLLLAPKTLIDLTIQLDPSLPTIFSLHLSEDVFE